MDQPEVAARKYHRPSHLTRRLVREVHQLQIEMALEIDGRIGVPATAEGRARRGDVQAMVVMDGFGSYQAADDAGDARAAADASNGTDAVALVKWRTSVSGIGDGGAILEF